MPVPPAIDGVVACASIHAVKIVASWDGRDVDNIGGRSRDSREWQQEASGYYATVRKSSCVRDSRER